MKKIMFLGMLMASFFLSNAQVKISALPAATDTPALSSLTAIVESGVTKKATLQKIKNAILNNVTAESIGGWELTGNSGTNPATNFIGPTDGQQLSIYSWHNGNYNNNAGLVLYGDYSVSPTSFNLSCPDSGRNTNHQILGSGDNIAITSSNFLQDSLSYIDIHRDSIYAVFYAGAISQPFTIYPNAVKIVDGTQGAGKVLTSDANGLASWQPTSFTASDSATIYALTPANGTTYFCSDCSGDGVTGRIVSYFGSLWRRLKFD